VGTQTGAEQELLASKLRYGGAGVIVECAGQMDQCGRPAPGGDSRGERVGKIDDVHVLHSYAPLFFASMIIAISRVFRLLCIFTLSLGKGCVMNKKGRWLVVLLCGVISSLHSADQATNLLEQAPVQYQFDELRPCRESIVCAACLEKYRDTFPVSLLIAYGKCCASCPCVQTEEQARVLRELEDGRGPIDDGLYARGRCGDPKNYHCTGRIVRTHCPICAVELIVTCGVCAVLG